jgi:hypothetical protein
MVSPRCGLRESCPRHPSCKGLREEVRDAGRKLPILKSEQQKAANHEKWKNDPAEQYHVD